MKRSIFAIAAGAGLLLWGSARAADFALEFDGCPGQVKGSPGEEKDFDIFAALNTTNNDSPDGAQGWSLGITVDGGEISDILLEGIEVSTIFQKAKPPADPINPSPLDLSAAGFSVAEVAVGGNGGPLPDTAKGAVSAIVLNTQKKQVLQPTGTQHIALLKVKGTIPSGDAASTLSLKYADGLVGSGQPVNNVVTFNSASVTPALGTCDISLIPPRPEFIFSIGELGTPDAASGDNVITRNVAPGDIVFHAEARLTTSGLPAGDGPQGWSLSIVNEPCMTVDNVTVEGVVVSTIFQKAKPPADPIDPSPLDLASAGFSVAETATGADPSPLADDAAGVVAAIVLNTQKKQVLHANATDPILLVDYKLSVALDVTTSCKASFVDGLLGSGQPVNNVITYLSASKTPTTLVNLVLNLTGGVVGPNPFTRGNPNGDGKVDIADAIWIVYSVVPGLDPTGQYPILCKDSGDVNGDGSVDLADAIYIIDYSFRGGPPPAAPFPGCGTDGATTDSCPKGSISGCGD